MATIRLKTRRRKQDSTRLIWRKRASALPRQHPLSKRYRVYKCVCVCQSETRLFGRGRATKDRQSVALQPETKTNALAATLPPSLSLFVFVCLSVCVCVFGVSPFQSEHIQGVRVGLEIPCHQLDSDRLRAIRRETHQT